MFNQSIDTNPMTGNNKWCANNGSNNNNKKKKLAHVVSRSVDLKRRDCEGKRRKRQQRRSGSVDEEKKHKNGRRGRQN